MNIYLLNERAKPEPGHSPIVTSSLTARQSHASHPAAKPYRIERETFRQSDDWPCQFEKYFSIVAGFGLEVTSETKIINSEDTMTIGTTGMKPKTAVPPGVRESTSVAPNE